MIDMTKKRIIVKGNVQGVGYRAFVRWFANDLGVTGRVKNLPDRSVEIYCEGDAKALDDFIKAIDVKSKDMHMLKMNVKSMTIHEEGTKEYFSSKAPKRSKDFKIYYGAGLKRVDWEAMDRGEITVLAAQDLSKSIDGVGQKVDTGFKDLGQKVEGVGQDVRAMHKDMNVRFDKLDAKYHILGESLVRTTESIEHMNENNAKTNDNIKMLIEGNAKTNDNIAKMNEDLSVIARALLELVQSNIKEKGRRARKAKG